MQIETRDSDSFFFDPECIVYVNKDAYIKYILWRCCFYEQHQGFPAFACPVSEICIRYHQLAIENNFAVEVIEPCMFYSVLFQFREDGVVELGTYELYASNAKVSSSGSMRRTSTVRCCFLNHVWARKYQRFLYKSIAMGCVDITLGSEAIDAAARARGVEPAYKSRYDPGEYEKIHSGSLMYEQHHPRACEPNPPTDQQRKTYEYLEKLKTESMAFQGMGTFDYSSTTEDEILDRYKAAASDAQDMMKRVAKYAPAPRRRYVQDIPSCVVVVSKYVSQMHMTMEKDAIEKETIPFFKTHQTELGKISRASRSCIEDSGRKRKNSKSSKTKKKKRKKKKKKKKEDSSQRKRETRTLESVE